MEEKICLILRDLGMLSRFTGYKYLKDAILLELECEGSLELSLIHI